MDIIDSLVVDINKHTLASVDELEKAILPLILDVLRQQSRSCNDQDTYAAGYKRALADVREVLKP